jgi:hypothetical protein
MFLNTLSLSAFPHALPRQGSVICVLLTAGSVSYVMGVCTTAEENRGACPPHAGLSQVSPPTRQRGGVTGATQASLGGGAGSAGGRSAFRFLLQTPGPVQGGAACIPAAALYDGAGRDMSENSVPTSGSRDRGCGAGRASPGCRGCSPDWSGRRLNS